MSTNSTTMSLLIIPEKNVFVRRRKYNSKISLVYNNQYLQLDSLSDFFWSCCDGELTLKGIAEKMILDKGMLPRESLAFCITLFSYLIKEKFLL